MRFENQSPVDTLCLGFLVCGLSLEAEWAWKLDIKIAKISETAKSGLTLEKIFTPEMLKFLPYIGAFACQTVPKCAKHLKLKKIERFWDLEMPFFFVIFAEHLTQISVFMSRYNYEDTHGWTSLDTYMGRLLKRVLWMYVETGLSIKLPVYVLP